MDAPPVKPMAPAPPQMPAGPTMTLQVHPTTGGHFAIDVDNEASVDNLKCLIARQLRLPKERLSLLFRETHLRHGSLKGNGVSSGCKLTLLPVVESGLVSQRQDQTLIQALQHLTEAQVDNFLCGKQPLTLALRLGNHMVFVQLQLAGSPAAAAHQNPQSNHLVNTATQTCQRNQERLHRSNGNRSTTSTGATSAATMTTTSNPARPATPPCIVRMPSQPRCPRSQCPVHGKPVCLSAADQAHHFHRRHPPHPLPMTPPPSPTSPLPPSPTSPSSPHGHHHQWPPRSGAFIESVQQHSPGIFSGTFSGILGTAVQDQQGRPRRDISTIAHILNDLLQAAPFYKQHLSTMCCQHRGSRHHRDHANSKTGQYRVHPGRPTSAQSHHQHASKDIRRQDLFVENDHTRSKMAHLQTMMRERQARRQARREMQGPYMPVHHTASAKAAAMSIPEQTAGPRNTLDSCGGNTTERAMSENCYPSLKQDFLAV
ncbi:midnolin-A-like [Amphiura filiformis]|uniref:midnolin-A-like n=1 Tax=Amphiura filiformis TaxID=82378 RepID=UPI003B2216CC